MMKNAKKLLLQKLNEICAEGLCNPSGDCGCSISDLAPCGCLDLDNCFVAEKHGDAWFVVMDQEDTEKNRGCHCHDVVKIIY